MYSRPLSVEGLCVNFNVFPFIPDDIRIPYDCPHLSWLGIENQSLSELHLGLLLMRVRRYVIQDLGEIPFVVAETAAKSRGIIIYNDMKPVLLNSSIVTSMDKTDDELRKKILAQCYPEDLMIAFLKAQEPGITFDKIIEYLSIHQRILESL